MSDSGDDLFGSDSDGDNLPTIPRQRTAQIADLSDEEDSGLRQPHDQKEEAGGRGGRSGSRSRSRSRSRSKSRSKSRSTSAEPTRGARSSPRRLREEREVPSDQQGDSVEERRRGQTPMDGDDAEEDDLFGESSDEDRGEPAGRDAYTISGQFPTVPRPQSGPDNLLLMRLPLALAVEPGPFDPISYQAADDSPENLDQAAPDLRIRWRKGQHAKESNAKIVRWSDDTYTLIIGSEQFDLPVTAANPHQFLVAQYAHDQILQTHAVFRRKMDVRPFDARTLSQRRFAQGIARHQKAPKTKFDPTLVDPMRAHNELMKAEKESLKARRRLEAKRRNAAASSARRLGARDLEEFSDEDRYDRGNSYIQSRMDEYEKDDFVVEDEGDDSEEEEAARRARIMKAKKAPRAASPERSRGSSSQGREERLDSGDRKRRSSERDDPNDEESSEDEEEEDWRRKKRGRTGRVMVSDEDE
ncbi:Paf1 complex component [Borealophlyctis nickersoniae]|nr:Paf1 complex component [Borealophlyctis nickersoniae]